MSYSLAIQKALDTRLSELNTGIDIAWSNVNYTPVKGTPWIRPNVLMSLSSLMDLYTRQLNEGIYQIDIFYPLGNGAGDALAKADEIYTHFKSDMRLVSGDNTIFIKEITNSVLSDRQDAWFHVIVEIHFKVYSN